MLLLLLLLVLLLLPLYSLAAATSERDPQKKDQGMHDHRQRMHANSEVERWICSWICVWRACWLRGVSRGNTPLVAHAEGETTNRHQRIPVLLLPLQQYRMPVEHRDDPAGRFHFLLACDWDEAQLVCRCEKAGAAAVNDWSASWLADDDAGPGLT